MILLDLFSGIGGFHLGLERAGFNFDTVYFSEIDQHAIANYKYNFKKSEYVGDVKSVPSKGIRRPNIITFGSPCQDFSLAGKRKGLEGERSSLITDALRTVSEFRPDVFIWENVKGAFSSNNSEDFWAIIQAFANIGGYRLEWQLLNTSWVLPQNRERIYLVGHLTESFPNWKTIFPITEDDFAFRKKTQSERHWTKAKHCSTLSTVYGGRQTDTCLKIHSRGRGFCKDSINEVCPTIRGSSFEHNTSVIHVPSATKKGYEIARSGDSINLQFLESKTRRGRVGRGVAQTLDCNCEQGVYKGSQIRRLTEIECERLQGFPDDWTRFGNYGEVKEIAKTNRYKMIGNAVTADIVKLVGERILNNK